nr:response regulator [candidate division Zixibacteria bacterium]
MKEVVFIDDDMMTMRHWVKYLELDHFVVKSFEEDIEALSYIDINHDKIGLIILDMIMPSEQFKMEETKRYFDTGWHLLDKIRTIMPDVPVIIFSIRHNLKASDTQHRVERILIKDQTTPENLSEIVGEILNGQ